MTPRLAQILYPSSLITDGYWKPGHESYRSAALLLAKDVYPLQPVRLSRPKRCQVTADANLDSKNNQSRSE